MKSSRWDANGNIYLVTEESLTPGAVRAEVADTDGILEVFRSGDDWVEIAIWNPDGSRAEMSGNGTRIAARWLADARTPVRITLEAMGDGLDWTPYDGIDVPGTLRHVLARGDRMVEEGHFTGAEHAGAYLPVRMGRAA